MNFNLKTQSFIEILNLTHTVCLNISMAITFPILWQFYSISCTKLDSAGMYWKVMRSNLKSLQGCFVFSWCFSFFLNLTRSNIPSTRWSTWDISKETAMPWVSPRCSSIKFHFCVSFCKKPRATQNISLTATESLGVKHSYKNKERSDSWHIVAKLYFTAA